jgi:hypothetical protein
MLSKLLSTVFKETTNTATKETVTFNTTGTYDPKFGKKVVYVSGKGADGTPGTAYYSYAAGNAATYNTSPGSAYYNYVAGTAKYNTVAGTQQYSSTTYTYANYNTAPGTANYTLVPGTGYKYWSATSYHKVNNAVYGYAAGPFNDGTTYGSSTTVPAPYVYHNYDPPTAGYWNFTTNYSTISSPYNSPTYPLSGYNPPTYPTAGYNPPVNAPLTTYNPPAYPSAGYNAPTYPYAGTYATTYPVSTYNSPTYPYAGTNPPNTGASASAFGVTFPGGVGGAASAVSATKIVTTYGSGAPITIPSGAYVVVSARINDSDPV